MATAAIPPGATETLDIATPEGPARAHVYAGSGRGTIVLGHGAGGGVHAPDLALLSASLPGDGFTVVLVEQPWRVAGRRIAGRPPTLDAAWVPILAAITHDGPLVVGGRSAGARVACRTASQVGAVAVLCLSFPLHPPGKPDKSRAAELRQPVDERIPVRVIQGASDPWGSPAEVRAVLDDPAHVLEVAGGHSFSRKPVDVLGAARTALEELLPTHG